MTAKAILRKYQHYTKTYHHEMKSISPLYRKCFHFDPLIYGQILKCPVVQNFFSRKKKDYLIKQVILWPMKSFVIHCKITNFSYCDDVMQRVQHIFKHIGSELEITVNELFLQRRHRMTKNLGHIQYKSIVFFHLLLLWCSSSHLFS